MMPGGEEGRQSTLSEATTSATFDTDQGDIHGILRRYFGYTGFRAGQQELIEQLLRGGDCLGIMPTGAGKSLCYQVPALALAATPAAAPPAEVALPIAAPPAQKPASYAATPAQTPPLARLALVISPLISLMQDQVRALQDAGVAAAFLNSTLSPSQRAQVLRLARRGYFQLLYVAPERLEAPDFLDFAREVQVVLVAVDEAHCISQWGQDFRPGYLRIPAFIDQLASRPPVGAFTATATPHVRKDIISLLHLHEPLVVATGFDRPNLHFAISRPRDKFAHLEAFLRERANASGIIYCSTRATVEEVCEQLLAAGFAATRYHAGLGERERLTNQNDFICDRSPFMVATNAFGMGIDKSNVNFVVHYNMPMNLESYYQEAGRAGRDGTEATCLLLYAPADVQTARYLITHGQGSTEDADARAALQEKDLELLKQMTFYATTNDCLRAFILRYFGERTAPSCDNCSNCRTAFEELDVTIEAQKIISCVYRLAQRDRSFGKSMVVDILRGSRNKRILTMRLDTLSTYGIMTDTSLHRVHLIMDHLIASDYLALSDGEYPVVLTTPTTRTLLKGDAHFVVKLPREPPAPTPEERAERRAAGRGGGAGRDGRTATAASRVAASAADPALFEKLRALRFSLAQEAEIPAYIVFSDASLRDMTHRLPQTEAEFLEVSGVGATKLERYGAAFLACITEHLDKC
jgi:ATP-dependent DNA helicase RecQ